MRCCRKSEGLSIKRLVGLFISKITGLLKVKVKLIQLNSPRKFYKFFNALKWNVRARGDLRKSVFDIYLILYQSFLFKSPEIFSFYLAYLLKSNIKKSFAVFSIINLSLPDFCKLFSMRGVRLQLKGRIRGARRTRTLKIQWGQIPLTTFSNNTYYSFNKIITIHGIYGLKVWYYV